MKKRSSITKLFLYLIVYFIGLLPVYATKPMPTALCNVSFSNIHDQIVSSKESVPVNVLIDQVSQPIAEMQVQVVSTAGIALLSEKSQTSNRADLVQFTLRDLKAGDSKTFQTHFTINPGYKTAQLEIKTFIPDSKKSVSASFKICTYSLEGITAITSCYGEGDAAPQLLYLDEIYKRKSISEQVMKACKDKYITAHPIEENDSPQYHAQVQDLEECIKDEQSKER